MATVMIKTTKNESKRLTPRLTRLTQLADRTKEAHHRLNGIITKTELIHSPFFSEESGNKVFIKPENFQKTGAFKIRGAYNKLAQLTTPERQVGVITASAGNHAQGIAYAAKLMDIEATVVMPTATPLLKVNATKSYGAKVVLHGETYDDAYRFALEQKETLGLTFVHPFDDLDVIAGQGTIGLEILEALPETDVILVPVGGGGLASGIAAYVKAVNPRCKVIGVEPEGAMSMKTALTHGKITRLDAVHTVADGVAVKEVGRTTFELCSKYLDDMITVSDYDIMDAFLMLIEKHKIVSENAGALSLAALKKLNARDQTVVSVLSGGNIDVVTMSAMINKGLSRRGRIFCFSVDLPDTPGQLLTISQVLADHKANVIKLDHNQFMNFDRFSHVQLQVTVETNGHDHIKSIIGALNAVGYVVRQVY